MSAARARLLLLLAIALAGLLTACGGEQNDGSAGNEDVASLSSGAARSTTPAARDDRPLIRADTSEEERQHMHAEYERCLKEHGFDPKKAKPTDETGRSRMTAAEQKCEHKRPEQPWERAKRTDPEYADKLRGWVACVRALGIDATDADGRLTLTTMPTDEQLRKINDCQHKAFSAA